MKNQYWHFGYVFVIGALSFIAFWWYQEVKDLERDLVDATETIAVINQEFLWHQRMKTDSDIRRVIRQRPKHMEWGIKSAISMTESDSMINFLQRLEKTKKIDWAQINQRYSILTDSIISRVAKAHKQSFTERFKKNNFFAKNPPNISDLSNISQRYWLEKYKANTKMASFSFLNYAFDSFIGYDLRQDGHFMVVSPKKCATKLGEEVELEIAIVSYGCQDIVLQRDIVIQGKKFELPKYIYSYIYKQKATKLGRQKIEIMAHIRNPTTGEIQILTQDWSYEVIP